MSILGAFIFIAWFLGIAMGALLVWGWRMLSRIGTTEIISIDPHTTNFDRSFVRKTGAFWTHKHGEREGLLPVSEAQVYTRGDVPVSVAEDGQLLRGDVRTPVKVQRKQGGSQRLLIVDGAALVPVSIDPATSRAVHPDGERLKQVGRSQAYHRINEEEVGMDWMKAMPFALGGLLIIGVMVVILLVKVGKIAAGMGG